MDLKSNYISASVPLTECPLHWEGLVTKKKKKLTSWDENSELEGNDDVSKDDITDGQSDQTVWWLSHVESCL